MLFQASTRTAGFAADAVKLTAAVDFTSELLQEISPKFFETADSSLETPAEHLGLTLANALYEAADMKTASITETEGRELLTSGFVTAIRLAKTCADEVTSGTSASPGTTKLLTSTLAILTSLSTATSHSSETLRVAWRPEDWAETFVRCLSTTPARTATFPLHAAMIRAILTLAKTPTLRPALRKNNRLLVEALASKVRSTSSPKRCVG